MITDSNPKKILVIRLKQIGDALLSLPVCNSLRAAYPDAEIDYLVYEHIAVLLQHQPGIDHLPVITPQERNNKWRYFKKVLWLRQQRYDLVLDLINVPVSAITARFTGAALVVGFNKGKLRDLLYHVAVPHPEYGDTVSKKLEILNGLQPPVPALREWSLTTSDSLRQRIRQRLQSAGIDFARPVVYIAATSRKPDKFWPIEYLAEVLNHLLDHYPLQLVFNHVPGPEAEFTARLLKLLHRRDDVLPDLELSLPELPAAISLCDFFFGNDGGPNHMAIGADVPSLAIFSPIHEKESWLPVDSDRHQGVDIKDGLGIDTAEYRARLREIKSEVGTFYRQIKPSLVIERLDAMLGSILK